MVLCSLPLGIQSRTSHVEQTRIPSPLYSPTEPAHPVQTLLEQSTQSKLIVRLGHVLEDEIGIGGAGGLKPVCRLAILAIIKHCHSSK